jgi:hypothetical protein
MMVAAARSSSFGRTLWQQSSTTMQALTSSFPSSTRSHNGVQLDNIIFYSGPASAKTRETTPIDADEWSDIDMIFAEEWVATTEQLDPTGGFDITREGERYSQFLHSGLPSNVLVIRHPECNRSQLGSAGDYASSSAPGGRQHAAMQPFRPLARWSRGQRRVRKVSRAAGRVGHTNEKRARRNI